MGPGTSASGSSPVAVRSTVSVAFERCEHAIGESARESDQHCLRLSRVTRRHGRFELARHAEQSRATRPHGIRRSPPSAPHASRFAAGHQPYRIAAQPMECLVHRSHSAGELRCICRAGILPVMLAATAPPLRRRAVLRRKQGSVPRSSTSRCWRPSTSTSTSTRRKQRPFSSRRAWPSAGTRGSSKVLQPRAQRAAAAHPLRRAPALPADQRARRRNRRRHRRRHRDRCKRRIILPFAGGLAETDHVLGHELVHAFQFDMASRATPKASRSDRRSMRCRSGSSRAWPSISRSDRSTRTRRCGSATRRRARRCRRIDKLDDPDFFPYRYGHAFWAYVAGRWGDAAVGDMLRATGPRRRHQARDRGRPRHGRRDVDARLARGDAPDLRRRSSRPHGRPTAFGRALITRQTSGGELNVAPALSPDGRRMVFLSERSLFSIDMYLADVATGKVIRQLVETAGDPHFDSLQFLELGRRLGAGQPPVRVRGAQQGPAGPVDRRRRQRPPRARA